MISIKQFKALKKALSDKFIESFEDDLMINGYIYAPDGKKKNRLLVEIREPRGALIYRGEYGIEK